MSRPDAIIDHSSDCMSHHSLPESRSARVIIQYSRSACLGLRLRPASCLSVVVCLVSVVTPAYRKSIEARTNLFLFIFN